MKQSTVTITIKDLPNGRVDITTEFSPEAKLNDETTGAQLAAFIALKAMSDAGDDPKFSVSGEKKGTP